LEFDLGAKKRFDSVVIEEGWGRVQRYELQIKVGEQWRTILSGEGIGAHLTRRIPAATARFVRLNLLEARNTPTIWEFQLFDARETP
jgi:hypothetical protein